MTLKLFRWFQKKEADTSIEPEIELIIQELDDWLSREHALAESRADAVPVSQWTLLRRFAQLCTKVALVGSCRRGKADPGDVDLLYVPKNRNQVIEFLEQHSDNEALLECKDRLWRCTVQGKQFDFIETQPHLWGQDLVFFTGSREFNERVLRHARRRGYGVRNGRCTKQVENSDSSWEIMAFQNWSEERILTHLGLEAFIDPRAR